MPYNWTKKQYFSRSFKGRTISRREEAFFIMIEGAAINDSNVNKFGNDRSFITPNIMSLGHLVAEI